MLGNGWSEPSGSFYIRNGRVRNTTQKTRDLAVQSSLVMPAGHLAADFTSLNNNAGPSFGLIFGYSDPLNYYAAYRQVGRTSLLKVVRVVDGVETVVASAPCYNPTRGKTFRVSVSFATDNVILTVGNWSVKASGLAVSPGGAGFMVDGGGWSHIVDNFDATP